MPKLVPLAAWERYFAERANNVTPTEAARRAGMSKETALRWERTGTGSGLKAAQELGLRQVGSKRIEQVLSPEAKRALTDFPYWRKRYLGRRTVGWQNDAATTIVRLIEAGEHSGEEQRAVVNAPPGSGKSTTFTHDIPAWLICRDRATRIMLGSANSVIASSYSRRIRTTLTRRIPLKASTRDLRLGLAVDAVATLADDYGAFKPDNDLIWRAEEFTVLQPGDEATDNKEATVTAYGRDSGFLGGRFDVVLWDDLVTVQNMRSELVRFDLFTWWDTQAESRVEPGGVFILQGQRINANDLYRYCIDKRGEDGAPMYEHIKYQAHNESVCIGRHDKVASWPDSCLLDGKRLPYKKLAAIRENDARIYEVVYQQGDVNPDTSLIEQVWITGGEDERGVSWPGNLGGSFGVVPEVFKDGTAWSVITVDPSPTKWWGILWMAYHPGSDIRMLVRAERRKMPQNQLLDLDLDTGAYSGIAEEWRRQGLELGIPLDQMFVERNAAQRFMLQSTIWTEWTRRHGVTIVPHETQSNKTDPTYGLSALVAPLKGGRYRFPEHGAAHEEVVLERLIHEMTHYPAVEDSDLLMALWFFEHHLAKSWTPKQAQYQLNTPSYLREVHRGIASPERPKPRLRFRLGAGR